MVRILAALGGLALFALIGWTVGDSGRWLIDRASAQVGGWAHPARLNGLGNTVTQVVPGVNANVSRGGSLVLMACAATGNANTAYVQLFDSPTSTNVTLGTTVPTLSFAIPGNSAVTWALAASGVGFGTGVFAAATTTFNGSTAAAGTVDCNFGYL